MKKLILTGLLLACSPFLMAATPTNISSATSASAAAAPASISTGSVCQCGHNKSMKYEGKLLLEKWQHMTPEEKTAVQKKIAHKWQKASPAEKMILQEKILQKWQAIPPAEQTILLEKMRSMMNEAQNQLTPQKNS